MKPKFKVGQTVQLSTNGLGRTARGTSYEIISIRPADDDEFQYVIKSAAEAYQRCVARDCWLGKRSTQPPRRHAEVRANSFDEFPPPKRDDLNADLPTALFGDCDDRGTVGISERKSGQLVERSS